jgi:hypothetical protein
VITLSVQNTRFIAIALQTRKTSQIPDTADRNPKKIG